MTHRRLLLALMTLPLVVGWPALAATPASGTGADTARQSTVGSHDAPADGWAPQETAAPFNVMGRADAPVAIVEFSDLQCPYCASYALHTFPEIKRAYVDTGKVHYAASDFPLPFHAYAVPAAVAARCAGAQGKFWEYRDAVFADQSQLAADPFDALAGKLGLDVARFDACRGDRQQMAAVSEDIAQARQSGITSTPSFVIGRIVDGRFQGETLSGAKSFEEFSARIDALLPAAR